MHDGDGMGGEGGLGGAPIVWAELLQARRRRRKFWPEHRFYCVFNDFGGFRWGFVSSAAVPARSCVATSVAWLQLLTSSLPPLPLRCRARLLPVVVLILVVLLILSWLCQWEQLAVALAATRAAMQLCIGQRWNPAQWSPVRDTSSTETHR